MIFAVLLLFLIVLLLYYGYKKGTENEDYFKDWKIKYTKPKFMFGHSKSLWLREENALEFLQRIYKEFPEEKAIAIWDMRTPTVLIRDPQLIKRITVKEFESFMNHKVMIDDKMDPLVGNSLGTLNGQKWKEMRATLSPAFTGSKMRLMFQLINEVSNQLVDYLKKEVESSSGILECDMKDLCSKYANDVIALCAFGIKVDSLKNSDNDFYQMGKAVMDFGTVKNMAKFILIRYFPKLATKLEIRLLSASSEKFFKGAVLETMASRAKNNIHRPDMINLLMDVKKGTLKHNEKEEEHSEGFATIKESEVGKESSKREWTDDELIAQCLIFFLAGFENNSAMMTISAYEMVVNPQVQEKLFQEVKSVHDSLEGKEISYEILQKMKYLDNVVTEALRKWPPASVTERLCTKKFHYKDEETDLELRFEKGDSIWFAIYGLHHDPKYFPDPEKFIPERFNEENRDMINPDAYLPFGSGPRACIASRFALMEIKALLYHLVLHFEFVAVEKTQIPLVLKKDMTSFAKDIFLGIKLRQN